MKPSHIYAVHPAGYLVKFALDEGEHLADAVELLVEREYRPSHGDAWPRTPEGVPICPKHGEVMTQREKQGDTWYSHKVLDENGEVLYCRGYAGKSSPGWSVPAARRREEAGQKSAAPTQRSQQQTPSPQPSPTGRGSATPPPPPADDAPAGPGVMELPDYRKLALEAKTPEEFDYAAYMVLKNGLYTAVSRITAVRQAIVIGWKPSPRSNEAMLAALEVYRDKRGEAEGRGEAKTPASQFAKQEAMNAYNEAIKAG